MASGGAINGFDLAILKFLNHLSDRSGPVDQLMILFAQADLLKGGVILTLLWWVWFREGKDKGRDQSVVLATIIGAIVAVLLARSLAVILPFRLRPVLYFRNPGDPPLDLLKEWSSFPSDHASLYFALATGIFMAARQLGAFSLAYVALCICFPRVHLGLHYPTDILAGAALGGTVAYAANLTSIRQPLTAPFLAFAKRRPSLFYAGLFLLTQQIATLFKDPRDIGTFLLSLLR
ncbi:MAG: phosphatase PAP2 family protein [Deltaproteobacteria bacterium]|nr:phosphatase PAP2 family protein [Deltaproteobacteria bacterium]